MKKFVPRFTPPPVAKNAHRPQSINFRSLQIYTRYVSEESIEKIAKNFCDLYDIEQDGEYFFILTFKQSQSETTTYIISGLLEVLKI